MSKLIFSLIFPICIFGCARIPVEKPEHQDHTATEKWAKEYALMAVDYQKRNIKTGCGFKGETWHDDYAAHQEWAMKVSAMDSETDIEERKIVLEHCEKAASYTDKAIEQYNENIKNKCGLQGPIWHNDRDGHFAWAEAQSEETLKMHIELRGGMLEECKTWP